MIDYSNSIPFCQYIKDQKPYIVEYGINNKVTGIIGLPHDADDYKSIEVRTDDDIRIIEITSITKITPWVLKA
jgi:hypothetical protein